MDPTFRRGFRIGVYDVEPLAGRITGPNGSQHVQPKVMDVLVFLAQHAGELVERDTLLEQVWRRVTSEEVLTRCISELRRALGDERGSPAYIQTVPKRGYRSSSQSFSSPTRTTRPARPCARPRMRPQSPRHRPDRRARWRPSRCCHSTPIPPIPLSCSSASLSSRPSCRTRSHASIDCASRRAARPSR